MNGFLVKRDLFDPVGILNIGCGTLTRRFPVKDMVLSDFKRASDVGMSWIILFCMYRKGGM